MEISIRKCRKDDKAEIIDVCYHTGYMGEDARNHFSDKTLFGLLFCSYYPIYEPFNCFVAEKRIKNQKKVIGYVLSSLNTERQGKIYKTRFLWRILFRLFFISLWFHFKDFRLVIKFLIKRYFIERKKRKDFLSLVEYPAHLHIDILRPFQRLGIGSKLIQTIEKHMKKNAIKGVSLGTSGKNFKALSFYEKEKYVLLKISKGLDFWPGTKNIKSYYFGKKL